MFLRSVLLAACASLVTSVVGLGSQCTAPLGAGNSTASDPFWLQDIAHQGTAPYSSDPSSYAVFRNVKDYGATGDGTTDDTDAIKTYVVSAPIIAYYYTVLVGDAKVPPTLLASSDFDGLAVIDADPYIPNGYGAQWYVNQDNFYRSVRNFVIDLTQMSATSSATGLHWQVSQSTSLINIVVEMSTASGNNHRGIFMENGSGGFMGDLVFNGGQYGIDVGNQQFTVRNLTVNNANTGECLCPVYATWNWGWTFQGEPYECCLGQTGFYLVSSTESGQGVGSETIIDATVTDVTTFIQTAEASSSLNGSIVLNNIALTNVGTAVGTASGASVLAGGSYTIDSWAQGNVYSNTDASGTFVQSDIGSISKSSDLLASNGWIFGKTHPQYASYSASQFISVRSQGATGDGSTDDTAAIQALTRIVLQYAGCYIIYFDAGVYIVSSTITIPAGTQVVGEAWTTIMGTGSNFENYNDPQVVVRVGEEGSTGVAEITDMIFSTRGPTAGAIVVEWNVHDPSDEQGAAGTWDTYIILGGRDGTDLQVAECPAQNSSDGTQCFAAFIGLHITSGASAYLEGLWVWLADHDLDSSGVEQLTLWSARGILSESQGPVWMIGTGEHSIMYQYGLVGAANHYMGFIQTETPYFQPNPGPTAPFIPSTTYGDPTSWPQNAAWALFVSDSSNILIFGAGHYSFFQNYAQTCDASYDCQSQIAEIDSNSTNIAIYGLNTVYTTYQLSVDYNGIINYANNLNGLAETVTAWTL
ncbi:glycoside hydrolase family 55 protein [Postia placenta MAD-698-R-SB12]|uniref:Glycoside hydrolase family 55 protein n=1 Tax=Postia placenta MAD-698-R-SB12 TaxID=670580 RepID=A0A1X6NCQ2_9APHY|nr:glycoside hydrolase family 55 protein [Postia placenta MAD-698-R-SB12]OSX66163.1 glycoside hydrolase family 55 protein [Postia placenta MAD-698-R-SB12]